MGIFDRWGDTPEGRDYLERYRQAERDAARNGLLKQDTQTWGEQMQAKLASAASPEEATQLTTLINQGNRAYGYMRSEDPELRQIGAAMLGDVLAADRNFDVRHQATVLDQQAAQNTTRMQIMAQREARQFALGNELNSRYERLWSDMQKESAGFIAMRNAFTQMKAAAADPSGASDVALVKLFSKLTDPTTGVLQGEADAVAGLPSGGVAGLLSLGWRKTRSGEFLLPYERKQIVEVAQTLYGAMADVQEGRNVAFRERGAVSGLPAQYLDTLPVDTVSAGDMPKGYASKRYDAPAILPSGQPVPPGAEVSETGRLWDAPESRGLLQETMKGLEDRGIEAERRLAQMRGKPLKEDAAALRRGVIPRASAPEAPDATKAQGYRDAYQSEIDRAAQKEISSFQDFTNRSRRSGR